MKDFSMVGKQDFLQKNSIITSKGPSSDRKSSEL